MGPKSSETLHFPDIEESRKSLQIPIPAKIDQEGGSFEIDLGPFLRVSVDWDSS